MWETFISWYINSYLGQYVENLNAQQLSFALRQGELELENVPLKKNIFRSWGLPVEVRSGVVGRIRIEFNIFKYLRNEPVLVTIEDIYLVAGPLVLSEWDAMEEELITREAKLNSLDSHEARWKANNDLKANSGSYYSLYFSSVRIGASIVTKVIENLQLNVRNVHIRFEDDLPGDPRNRVLAFGVTLESLTAQSCDSKWNPLSATNASQADSSERSFKTLQLNKLAVYCDTKAERLSDCKPQELKLKIQALNGTHSYILCPVSAEARISKNNSSNPLVSSSKPRFDIHIILDKVPLHLADSQYRQLYIGSKSFRKLQRNCRLRHYRPFSEIKESPKDWWKYAIKAVLLARGYRSRKRLDTWEEILGRCRINVEYCKAYEKHLAGELLPFDVRKVKDTVEADLHYEELLILRELVMAKIDRLNASAYTKAKSPPTSPTRDVPGTENEETSNSPSKSSSVVSWMFPSWWGWVSNAEAPDGDPYSLPGSPVIEEELIPVRNRSIDNLNDSKLVQSQAELDEAILDDVKAFGQDTILARVNFVLKQGGVTLKKKASPFLDFEFSGLDFRMELRPRSGAHKLQLSLKSVLLRDFTSKSLIISPHMTACSKFGVASSQSAKDILEPVFRLTYDRKCQQKTTHRITVVTKPLDLVLYPVLMEDVMKYFSVDPKYVSDDLESPYSSYEVVKQRTKEELNAYWSRLLHHHGGSSFGSSASWEIIMRISAPQIIIHGSKDKSQTIQKGQVDSKGSVRKPLHLGNLQSGSKSQDHSFQADSFLVIDLGRFTFTNLPDEVAAAESLGKMTSSFIGSGAVFSQPTDVQSEENSYSDDEFLTPCSSPAPELQSPSEVNSPLPSVSDASEIQTVKSPTGSEAMHGLGDLHSRIYKKYKLEITDVQILVVQGKQVKEGNWETAVLRGTSPIHLLDKFSITLQMERRLIYCDNPSWPAVTLDGTLPKWNLHLNEGKLLTVRSVLNSFFLKNVQQEDPSGSRLSLVHGSQTSLLDDTSLLPRLSKQETQEEKKELGSSTSDESKLFVARFTVEQINVEIQHLGRSIAELQISGAKTTLVLRPIDTNVSFVIQSVLLADGIQTYGHDFELLLASHKHVCMDTVSGSLMDSEPTSPMSPQSPACVSPAPFATGYGDRHPPPSQFHQVLVNTLQSSRLRKVHSEPILEDRGLESEALITADLVIVHNDVAILNIQCNNLDVIANQETLLEINQFLQKAFPKDSGVAVKEKQSKASSNTALVSPSGGMRLQTSFEFYRLNVLLLRTVIGKDGNQCARKIATATATNARVNYSKEESKVVVEGSLGGLQVLNLTREGAKHQRVLSVGQDPLVEESYRVVAHESANFADEYGMEDSDAALSFEYTMQLDTEVLNPKLQMKMASVIYTHSPIFILDMQKCIGEFRVPLATKLRSAAAQIALGLVQPDSSFANLPFRSPSGSLSGSLDQLNITEDETAEEANTEIDRNMRKLAVELDIVLESPVVVLPRNRKSPEVFVANLGKITVCGNHNEDRFDAKGEAEFMPQRCSTPDVANLRGILSYKVLICDISLHTLDLTPKWNMLENLKLTFPACSTTSVMRAKELYHCDVSASSAILHNTVVQLNVEYANDITSIDSDYDEFISFIPDPGNDEKKSHLTFNGRVVNPLKVSLTPCQYSQLLESLGNIAVADEDAVFDELIVPEPSNDARSKWKADTFSVVHNAYTRNIHPPLPLPSPTRSGDDGMPINVSFEVPELIVDLVLPGRSSTNPDHHEAPLRLSCSDLGLHCKKTTYVMELLLSLKSLTLEDTQEAIDSDVRFLALSSTLAPSELDVWNTRIPEESEKTTMTIVENSLSNQSRFVSSSCPDIQKSLPITIEGTATKAPESSSWFPPSPGVRPESSSLPTQLDARDIFAGRFLRGMNVKSVSASRRRKSVSIQLENNGTHAFNNLFYPATPPPSPRAQGIINDGTFSSNNLVQITMRFIDSKSPQFFSKYKGTHRFVNVDFNALETILYPESFLCLRKFFAEVNRNSAEHYQSTFKEHPSPAKHSKAHFSRSTSVAREMPDPKNTETSISVQALGIKFATSRGYLARGDINNVTCNIAGRGDEFFGVDGRLGSLRIRDISPQVGKYSTKFTFQGDQALDFDYSKTGSDAKFRLQMSSVVCVHTHRFYTDFSGALTTLFGSVSSGDHVSGVQVEIDPDQDQENVKVSLDIQAGAPVLLFPYSSTTRKLLVADLGHLSVKNRIILEPNRSLVDIISVDLIEMDLFGTELQYNAAGMNQLSTDNVSKDILKLWVLDRKHSIVKSCNSSSLLREKCALKLKLRRLLKSTDPSQAKMGIEGTLTTVCCIVDPDKYKLIRGMLEYNLGEKLDDIESYVLPQASEVTRKRPEPRSPLGSMFSINVRKDLAIEINLVNVTMEVINDFGNSLSRIDFIKSKFSFYSNSDGTKDVDLASQEILICDTRFKNENNQYQKEDLNVFTNILQQSDVMNIPTPSTSGNASQQSNTTLQAEIHSRMTSKGSVVTIILNNVRLMLIIDWWMELQAFLGQRGPVPDPLLDASHMIPTLQVTSPMTRKISRSSVPVSVSAGIVTKRAPVLDVPSSAFELKLNVSNCELVLVEDPAVWDTNAIILKGTAVLNYKPHLERPITCTLLQCELFSCILGLEVETALSILDPTILNLEVVRKSRPEPQGLLDAALTPASTERVLKVQSSQLYLRLSYHDMRMFVKFVNSFSRQAKRHFSHAPADAEPVSEVQDVQVLHYAEASVRKLEYMGFSRQQSLEALRMCDGQVDAAAIYLTTESKNVSRATSEEVDNAHSVARARRGSQPSEDAGLSEIELRFTTLSLCVIDDCRDADVPLVELTLSQVELLQNYLTRAGKVDCSISVDFYNRILSGWEPLLEPWKCSISWKKNSVGALGEYNPGSEFPSKAPELDLVVNSRKIMNLNISYTMLSLYQTVSMNWSEDYEHHKVDRRRNPFVPYVLKNETGTKLCFTTTVPNNEDLLRQQRSLSFGAPDWNAGKPEQEDKTGWIQVANGASHAFNFEGRGKLRHRNTHALKNHQLVVQVDGWQEVIPVSVDKTGNYFRVAKPRSIHPRFGNVENLPPTRLVFEVTLMGSAQKLIRVRSALMLKNNLDDDIELKLENTIVYPSFAKEQTGGSFVARVKSGDTYPIPLHSVWAQLWVRPVVNRTANESIDGVRSLYSYCSSHLLVSHEDRMKCCEPKMDPTVQPYRFCVAVQKDEFPADEDDLYQVERANSPVTQYLQMSKKVNLITLVSPLAVVNLLPVEIQYEIRGKSFSGNVHGVISGGKESKFTHINTGENVEVHFRIENFENGNSIIFNTSSAGISSKLRFTDSQKRPLILNTRVVKAEGSNLIVYISCPFWVINKTGIPIVCKQDSTDEDAAGQFHEHEVARLVQPLLFSFHEQDRATALTLRVGARLHGDGNSNKPGWCRSFYLQNGLQVRKLHVFVPNSRTEITYLVGIEVKQGRGRYRETRLVTLSPRFIIDNRSRWKVDVSQKCFATSFADPGAESTHLSLTNGCNLPFHWPKLDKEQFLCVRLSEPAGCPWSGGFPVENVDSFHIPVRDREGANHFLRVEIVLQGPTYFVVLGDTDKLPPPFRIDNLSFVPVLFHQASVADEKTKFSAKAESSTPFAWDEPTLAPNLTVSAPGGTSTVISMNNLGLISHLTYENFFYIAFSATFPGDEMRAAAGVEALNLVFDVIGTKVVLTPKEPGKRSQLWRVNADGLIEHEGSSPPREPRKPPPVGSILVLDIAGSGPQPNQFTPLMLRKPDARRACTQHWIFTEDGRLKLEKLESLYVQAKDGFRVQAPTPGNPSEGSTWCKWSEVVLGPDQPICYSRTESGIAAEQAVVKQKLRPGSGRLALKVDTDGPTRVLRIIDVEKPPRCKKLQYEIEEDPYNTIPRIVASVNLKAVGISIINCKPREELIYAKLTSFNLKYSDSKECEYMDIMVENFQIDNQLAEAEVPVPIFVLASPRELDSYSLTGTPALQLSWVRLKSNLNAHIFKTWELGIKPLNLTIEEKLLLKLCNWVGLSNKIKEDDTLQESDFEVQRALTNATSLTAKRFYFGQLSIDLNHVRLSVVTSTKLPNDLALVKRRLGLRLIQFEDAHVELDPFVKQHPFETFQFLIASLVKHYRDELVSRAAIILGSTDFLGNPLGFVNDVTVGFSGLIYEGSVGSLVKNVTHGISNSAAKVTGTLGDHLPTFDSRHEDERRRYREGLAGTSTGHLKAGAYGFFHGVTGGLTSLITNPIEGALSDGFTGFVAGVGKGLVGTVVKPAKGILDLAAGTANAIKDSSKSSFRISPERCRPRRVASGNGGLLPLYSEMASRGQELLFEINTRDYDELYIAHEALMSGPGRDLKILLSSQNIYIYKPSKPNQIMLKIHLGELVESRVVIIRNQQVCIELIRLVGGHGHREQYSPQVTCDSELIASRVVQQINYAKVLFEEMRHSQIQTDELSTEY